ncbi:MAG: CRISPR-associated endonuclease Cas1 [Anaerolineae bacterium]|nr:CRISPR-associated endonuclease Cas1 [Anaerolineae bacterium]
MPPLYVSTQGARLACRVRRLVVEKDDQVITTVPAAHVSQVVLLGNVSLTPPALTYLLGQGIEVVFLTVDGRYKGRLVGPERGNGLLRLRQYERVRDPDWALGVARAVVSAKLHNLRTLLRRYARRADAPEKEEGTTDVPSLLSAAADQLSDLIPQAERARTLNSLNGVEGRGSAVYFSVFRHLIAVPGWRFEKRARRPPPDPVNALLSFGYTLLTHHMEWAVWTVGLDPYLGFLHQAEYNRPSLALDLMEPFRPILVDSLVLRCLNNEILKPDHFEENPEGPYPVRLGDEGRSRFIREWEGRLNLELTHPVTGERMDYRRCLEVEVRRLAQAIQTGEPFRPFQVR